MWRIVAQHAACAAGGRLHKPRFRGRGSRARVAGNSTRPGQLRGGWRLGAVVWHKSMGGMKSGGLWHRENKA